MSQYYAYLPVPVAARSKAWVYGRRDRWFESHRGMDICLLYVSCVLSGRGLCDDLITRPQESYRLWPVVLCDQETS
jgi:hypothetical protein